MLKRFSLTWTFSLAMDTLHAYILVRIVTIETIMVSPSNGEVLLHCAVVEQTVLNGMWMH